MNKIMSKIVLFLLVPCLLIVFQGSVLAVYSSSQSSNRVKFIPNEIIVKFKSDIASSDGVVSTFSTHSSGIEELNQKYGMRNMRKLFVKENGPGILSDKISNELEGIYKITISKGADIHKIASEYASLPDVEFAEPNFLYEICRTPNDPDYNKQWGLFKISASGGWDAKVGDPEIVIAVIDTGVDYNHPDLASNIWVNSREIPGNGIDDDGNGYIDDIRGWDFVSVSPSWVAEGEDPGPPDPDPMDFCGHGSHVSGIAAGATNNSIGTAGTTWNCKIMPLRAGYLAYNGYGYLEFDDCAEAVAYAVDNGADIISMSWGCTHDSYLMRKVMEYAYSKGSVSVAAAGNVTTDDAGKPFYPAAYPGVIAVASIDKDDNVSIWSWEVFSNFGDFVDVVAPGTMIYSTIPNGGYSYYSGTSMATPFVSGLAALIKSQNRNYSNCEVEEGIKATADDVYSVNPKWMSGLLGAGRINVYKALGSPHIAIAYPRDGSKVVGSLIIEGSADIENFQGYKLEWGIGKDPSSWMGIGSIHTSPVIKGILGKWDAEGLSGDYSIKLTVMDEDDNSYSQKVSVNISPHAEVELTKPTLAGPNPFSPITDMSKIVYTLGSTPAGGVDVDVCIYDITGMIIWKVTKSSNSGDNSVFWDGKTQFGELVGNGVYPYLLVVSSGGSKKVLGRSKIAVVK